MPASSSASRPTPGAVRQRVYEARIEHLALVLSTESAYVECPEAGGTRFRCPRCLRVDHNGGSALVCDSWHWRCSQCRAAGTYFELADRVLYDPRALFELMMTEDPNES